MGGGSYPRPQGGGGAGPAHRLEQKHHLHCHQKVHRQGEEPDFVCHPLAERETVQREETEALIEKMFGGSSELFFSSFLRERGVSEEEAKGLLRLIQKKGGEKE